MKILKGDQVKIRLGKDKGRTGEVILSYPKSQKVVVKGLNLYQKTTKSTQSTKGGIIEKERPLAVSKVGLICSHCQKMIRVAYRLDKTGGKLRYCPKCQNLLISKTK
jgi:large subunit ribosomal protein L24